MAVNGVEHGVGEQEINIAYLLNEYKEELEKLHEKVKKAPSKLFPADTQIVPNILKAMKAINDKHEFVPFLFESGWNSIEGLPSSAIGALDALLTGNYFQKMIEEYLKDEEEKKKKLNQFIQDVQKFISSSYKPDAASPPSPLVPHDDIAVKSDDSEKSIKAVSSTNRNAYFSNAKWSAMITIVAGALVKTGRAIRFGLASDWRTTLGIAGALFASFEGMKLARHVFKNWKYNKYNAMLQDELEALPVEELTAFDAGKKAAEDSYYYYIDSWPAYLSSPDAFYAGLRTQELMCEEDKDAMWLEKIITNTPRPQNSR